MHNRPDQRPLWRARGRLPSAHLRRSFSSLSASTATVAVTSFASTVVLARVLTPKQFGQVVFAQATAQALFVVLDPRLEDALVRYVPRVARTRRGAATNLFRRLVTLDVALGLGFGAL